MMLFSLITIFIAQCESIPGCILVLSYISLGDFWFAFRTEQIVPFQVIAVLSRNYKETYVVLKSNNSERENPGNGPDMWVKVWTHVVMTPCGHMFPKQAEFV